jgi:hypothetical protein
MVSIDTKLYIDHVLQVSKVVEHPWDVASAILLPCLPAACPGKPLKDLGCVKVKCRLRHGHMSEHP